MHKTGTWKATPRWNQFPQREVLLWDNSRCYDQKTRQMCYQQKEMQFWNIPKTSDPLSLMTHICVGHNLTTNASIADFGQVSYECTTINTDKMIKNNYYWFRYLIGIEYLWLYFLAGNVNVINARPCTELEKKYKSSFTLLHIAYSDHYNKNRGGGGVR